MGRIRVFFASCLGRTTDQAISDQSIDVSHLATPHISSSLSLANESSSYRSTPVGGAGGTDHEQQHRPPQEPLEPPVNAASAVHYQNNNASQEPSDRNHRVSPTDHQSDASHSPFPPQDNNNNSRSQPSPTQALSPLNLYEPPQQQSPRESQQQQPPLSLRTHNVQAPPAQPHALAGEPQPQQGPSADGTSTKLSYDIISVREPLAKILAERQQRQILGDHEYIEVYGERGSSCFYEEIAGSTTSSATYDQIGVISNNNYQALINAYAVANRPSAQAQEESNNLPPTSTNGQSAGQNEGENMYDVTHSSDQVDSPPSPIDNKPSTSSFSQPQPSTSHQSTHEQPTSQQQQQHPTPSDRNGIVSQSIPVYSVINKATRKSNAIIRATIDSCRPPQPPPKNLLMNHQPSTSAIQPYQEPSKLMNTQVSPGVRSSPQIPTKSSYNSISEFNENALNHHTRLPQPPPRLSKLTTMFKTINRPLPLPDTLDNINNNNVGTSVDHKIVHNEDNGYELLSSNFDDDQIDVIYEKIRESSRYSGGSLSSQIFPLQAPDNGGYESVQPIYSSPSNALAEPNYEAISPATASEMAAAATARLTAVAAVIEKFQTRSMNSGNYSIRNPD